MTLTTEEKKAAIAARRSPLDHELYSAELDLKVAEADGEEGLVNDAKARVEKIQTKIKVLDDEEAELD
jgi:hypothetical protein